MTRIAVLYASGYGQTGRIAERIASTLRECGAEAIAHSLCAKADSFDPSEFDALIVGAPIYYGRHRAPLGKFVGANHSLLASRPSFFFSVSLAAASDVEKSQSGARAWRDEFLEKAGWEPRGRACFAGSLPYRDYNFFVRWMMKRIVRKEGGETDTSKNHEYTDWDAVADFARDCHAAIAGGNNEAQTE